MSAAENAAAARHLHPVTGGREDGSDEEPTRGELAAIAEGRPVLKVGSGPGQLRALQDAIGDGIIPESYVSDGSVVVLEQISGAGVVEAGDADISLPLAVTELTPDLACSLLARHVYVARNELDKATGSFRRVEFSPSKAVLGSALAPRCWPDLRPLRRLIGAPVLRRDGTLLQEPGYDSATGLYLTGSTHLPKVPARPSAEQVEQARAFLLTEFLADFPWRTSSDLANYLGVLFTPVLRPYTGALSPFVVIDATTPGSGKTILTSAAGAVHGQRVLTWTDSDEELRKAITSVMAQDVGVVVFDNIPEGAVISSAVLARLITERTWTDRKLGSNTAVSFPNDRLWLATGNNLRIGGDMASRTVYVRLDPDMPNPEQRTGFTIPNLDTWILDPINQATVMFHLLVLVLDWTAAGAPQASSMVPMRQFTTWAKHVGGLLEHHQITGFLANQNETKGLDDEASEWRVFLLTWWELHGSTPISAHDLRRSAEPEYGSNFDRWNGVFLSTPAGKLLSVKSLGRHLTGQIGRWRGDIVLRSVTNPHLGARQYWVERAQPGGETE